MTGFAYVARHWRGELSLGKSLWLNLILPFTLALVIRNWWTDIQIWTGSAYSMGGVWVLTLGVLLLCMVIATWQVVGVWRAAGNNPESRASPVAKTATLFYALLLLPNLLFLVLGLRSIDASDFRLKKWAIDRMGDVVTIRGYLGYGIADAFLEEVRDRDTLIVSLDSRGGIVLEANTIAGIIHERRLNTVVSGECLSACTTIFAAGYQRIMLSQGNIGFHSTRSLYAQDTVGPERAEYHYQPLLERGFPPEMVEQVMATPFEGMWYPPTMPLLNSGFITDIAADMEEALLILGITGGAAPAATESAAKQTPRTEMVQISLMFSEGAESLVDIPVPSGLATITPGSPLWDVATAATISANRLLLVLVPESDVDALEEGEDSLQLYARVEQISGGIRVPESKFGMFRESLAAHYRGAVPEIQERLPRELQKGSQRLSQTTLSDVRLEDAHLTSVEILASTDQALVVQMRILYRMLIGGEPFEQNWVAVQTIIQLGGALIAINWYELEDLNGEVHEVHTRAGEMRRLLGKE